MRPLLRARGGPPGATDPRVAAGAAPQASDPRDFSGHWDRTSPIVSFGNVPSGAPRENPGVQEAPFTPEGRKMYEANKPGYGPATVHRSGTIRSAGASRSAWSAISTTEIIEPHNTFEIVQTPGRILQFFEYRHDWREIWMDGRTLPALDGRRAEVERLLGRPLRRQHARRRVDRLRRAQLGGQVRLSAFRADAPGGAVSARRRRTRWNW